MSSTIIGGPAAATYTALFRPVEAVPDSYHLQITSAFSGAKNPEEQRVVFAITLEREGLLALRDLIDAEVEA